MRFIKILLTKMRREFISAWIAGNLLTIVVDAIKQLSAVAGRGFRPKARVQPYSQWGSSPQAFFLRASKSLCVSLTSITECGLDEREGECVCLVYIRSYYLQFSASLALPYFSPTFAPF